MTLLSYLGQYLVIYQSFLKVLAPDIEFTDERSTYLRSFKASSRLHKIGVISDQHSIALSYTRDMSGIEQRDFCLVIVFSINKGLSNMTANEYKTRTWLHQEYIKRNRHDLSLNKRYGLTTSWCQGIYN